MKTLAGLCFLLLLAPGFARAADLVTKEGVTYPDVTITETLPIGLSFISGGKAGWIDFRDLPDDVARQYGYRPKKAEEFESRLAQTGGDMVSPSDAPNMKSLPTEGALDAQAVPQTPENTVVVDAGQNLIYEPAIFPSSGPVCVKRWVYWHGHHYPWYWWHHWYWGHHWVYHHGRYYPWHYYHGHGIWYHGRYYPYHHGVLKHHCTESKPHEASHHGEHGGGGGRK